MDRAVLADSGGSQLDTVESPSGGDTISLRASLSSGSTYRVYLVGSNYTSVRSGYGNTAIGPATGMSSLQGYNDGSSSAIWNFDSTESLAPRTSATTIIEWPDPPDLYAWDRALFQRQPDGGTVDVYVEANDGTGWTEIAGPITRGDDIPADPADNVRFRVEFSRPDTSNNPALEAIYRRRVV